MFLATSSIKLKYIYTHIWCDHIKQRCVHLQDMNTQYLEFSGLKGLYNEI